VTERTKDRESKLYCNAPARSLPSLPSDMPLERQRAILLGRVRWVNETHLHYCFLDTDRDDTEQKKVVREAFDEWKSIGIGLNFVEVGEPAESEIRIGFRQGDGSWSHLGRDILRIGIQDRTMNFGWDLSSPYGRTTARHEIGHSLGLPHEHQSPNAGIVWDEDAVYEYLGGPPNNWDRATAYQNVLRKLDPREVSGSNWDPQSIMEYEFPSGLILTPEEYRTGVYPPGTLSDIDVDQALQWYPSLGDTPIVLKAFNSVSMELSAGQQFNAEIYPEASRKYSIGTFGSADVVLVLFEEVDGELRYLAGDDDSGEGRNALIRTKLFAGRRYVARIRMYYSWDSGGSAVMYW
jgi:hypothetical protein